MVYRALILSLLIHVGLLIFLWPFGSHRTVEANHQAKVEVGLVEVARHTPSPPAPSTSANRVRVIPALEAVIPEFSSKLNHSATDSEPSSAAPPTTAVTSGAAASPSALATYIERVRSDLNRAKVYPEDASEREQQGLVTLGLTLAPNGRVVEVKVEVPSPYGSLNEAALRAVAQIKHFPPLPTGFPADTLHLHVPVLFKINHD